MTKVEYTYISRRTGHPWTIHAKKSSCRSILASSACQRQKFKDEMVAPAELTLMSPGIGKRRSAANISIISLVNVHNSSLYSSDSLRCYLPQLLQSLRTPS